ncbi:unnamed protein product [Phyllotreta striolata]|uniref:Uncharacterized protein n=1 Tax=Phyllotreta striolata TaxID=444603 RepID=A0A9N9XM10_PHYSR|nr:unnamed protein product [Phyllotreta striolata]
MEFFNFKGKTVLVTGASQGIGREIAKQMARRQAKVIASARNAEALQSLRDEEPSIEILPMDLTRWKETEKALENVGHIDLLVNNAGMGFLDSLVNVTEEMFDERATESSAKEHQNLVQKNIRESSAKYCKRASESSSKEHQNLVQKNIRESSAKYCKRASESSAEEQQNLVLKSIKI